jgi:Transposase DDE domain group 1
MTEATLFLPGLSPVGGKTITATFDGGKLSSNGGVLILREIEKKLGLATVLSRHIPDDRDRMRITHSYSDMTRARMLAIASGHEDCDDLDVLRSDPALKMACGRLPVSGTDLMSQPTLSRLENAPFWRQLARMGLELIDLFCARFERVPRRIVLDIDDTDELCMDSSSLHCSTHMPVAIASSRSRSSRRRPAGPCCRCCAPASGHRARKLSKSCVTSSVASVATGPRSRS